MSSALVAEASALYGFASCLELRRHVVDHPAIRAYCASLGRLESLLADAVSDHVWLQALQPLRKLRFILAGAPVVPGACGLFRHAVACLDAALPACDVAYPSYSRQVRDLAGLLESLAVMAENPLLDQIGELARDDRNTALLLMDRELVRVFTQSVDRRAVRLPHVVVPSELRGRRFGRVIVVGPSRWFPEFVFLAPRAPRIDIVHFSWIADRPPLDRSLAGTLLPSVVLSGGELPRGVTAEIDSDRLVPEIAWDRLYAASPHSGSTQNAVEVTARLVVLEGGWAVLCAESSTKMVLNPDRSAGPFLARMDVRNLHTEVFLLLRTTGGGDYVAPVADRLLGSRAEQCRGAQALWKGLLRLAVERDGMSAAVSTLRELGSRRANDANVRNWMAAATIRPEAREDFDAILELVGLQERADELWSLAETIDRAHRSAGFRIRKLLLQRVLQADLHDLARSGVMEFHLDAVDGGSLTAFQVLAVSPQTYSVPEFKLDRPFLSDSPTPE